MQLKFQGSALHGVAAAAAVAFLMTMPSSFANANQFVGDLVYCDVAGEAGVYDPDLGDYGLDGVEVQVDCVDLGTNQSCGSFVTTTGTLDATVNRPEQFYDALYGCGQVATFDSSNLSGRYVVNILDPGDVVPGAGCQQETQCTVTVNPATLPADCSTIVTPIVDPVTPAGDVPGDGNGDGDYCDAEDGPFAEGQVLGDNSTSQANCEDFPSPGPISTGVHVSVSENKETNCSLYNDFGYTPGGACELEVETLCAVRSTAGLACEAKIAAFEMVYTGADLLDADVIVSGKSEGSAQYQGIDLVAGTTIEVDGRPGDLGSQTTISINGVSETIHTSCSAPFVAGQPAPLNNPKGDPSPNWTVVSFVDKQGVAVTAADPVFSEECTITADSSNTKKKKSKKSKKKSKKKKASDGSASGSQLVEYRYVITNPGSQSAFDVVAIDDVLGELEGSPISEIAPGESVVLSSTSEVLSTVTNTLFVSAGGANGAVCEAQGSSTVIVEAPPVSCADGKPQTLVFEYTGGSCADAVNSGVKDECSGDPAGANGVSIVILRDADEVSASPSSGIQVGDLVTISTTDNRFASTTELAIEGGAETQTLNIHTSCSDPLIVGESFGALRLVEFVPES